MKLVKELLESRYAVKHYEKGVDIEREKIDYLLEAMNLSASALGLQPYRFILVENEELIKKLAEHSFHGIELAKASKLIVIASMRDISDEYIENFIERTETIRGFEHGELSALEELTKRIVHSIDDHLSWAEKQSYLVMGTLLVSASEQGVDMTPMEIFDKEKYDEILGMKDTNYHSTLVAVLGKRKEGDPDQFLKKSRRDISDIVKIME